jgi:hypothetical protein
MLPISTAVAGDIDRGNIIIPDQSTFQVERLILSSNDAQAIVYIVVLTTGSCTSVAGGTLTVTSPAGAQVSYFNTKGDPSTQQTSFADLSAGRPVAVIFNATPGADVTFQVNHPTCHQAAYPVTNGGAQFTGQVTTKPSEPGDNNSAIVVVMQ